MHEAINIEAVSGEYSMYGGVQIGVRQAVKGTTCFLKIESNNASLLWL